VPSIISQIGSIIGQEGAGGGGATWGGITGTLSSQTDLQTALDGKQVTLVSGTNIKTINGNSLLGSGNIVVGGAVLYTEVEKSIGSVPKLAGKFTIAGSGLTVGKPVIISQAVGPYTGKGTRADEAEMDGLIVKAAVTAVDTITAYWNSATFVKGNFKFNYLVGA